MKFASLGANFGGMFFFRLSLSSFLTPSLSLEGVPVSYNILTRLKSETEYVVCAVSMKAVQIEISWHET